MKHHFPPAPRLHYSLSMQNANRSFCFRALAAVLALNFALFTVACMKNTTTGQPGSPNAGVVTAIETAAGACTVASVLETGPVAAWLAGPCVTSMTGLLNIVEANGTLAAAQATITALKATAAALPPGTPDLQYANAAIALAQIALNAYAAATGQTLSVAPPGASQFFASEKPRKINWTASEKARIVAAKAKLAKRK